MAHLTWTVLLFPQHVVILFRDFICVCPFRHIIFWHLLHSIGTDDAFDVFVAISAIDFTDVAVTVTVVAFTVAVAVALAVVIVDVDFFFVWVEVGFDLLFL